MARWMAGRDSRCFPNVTLVLLFLKAATSLQNHILYADGDDCGEQYILGGATIYSHYGSVDDTAGYRDGIDCTLKFAVEKPSWTLMMKFEYLDIPDQTFNGICTDAVFVYDSDKIGLRPFRAAGGTGGLCGRSAPAILYSLGPYMTLAFMSTGGGRTGRGFKVEVTALNTEDTGCKDDAFECDILSTGAVCIDSELKCDGVKHCPDGSDEFKGGTSLCSAVTVPDIPDEDEEHFWSAFQSLGIAAQVGICIGCIVILITLIVCVVFTCRRCGKKPGDQEQHRQSIPTSTHGSVHTAPPGGANKEGITYHQAPMNHQQQMMGQAMSPQYMQQGYYPMAAVQQHMPPIPQQRYVANHPPLMDGGAMQMGAMPPGGYNYNNSPFHMGRDPRESHSHSSGYSSQQGIAGAQGYQPMHTKPIVSHQRAYTPTTATSRSSSRSGSSMSYSRDPRGSDPRDRGGRMPVAL